MTACYCDYGYVEFYHKELRTARTTHVCYECSCVIQQGDKYEHVRSKCEGDVIYTADTCPRCLALRDWVEAHVPCFCWYHGSMREDAIETAKGWAHEAPGLLFGAYRREIAIRRNRAQCAPSS